MRLEGSFVRFVYDGEDGEGAWLGRPGYLVICCSSVIVAPCGCVSAESVGSIALACC